MSTKPLKLAILLFWFVLFFGEGMKMVFFLGCFSDSFIKTIYILSHYKYTNILIISLYIGCGSIRRRRISEGVVSSHQH